VTLKIIGECSSPNPTRDLLLEASIRPSYVMGTDSIATTRPVEFKDLTVGDVVGGIVSSSGPKGVFVTLSRTLSARIKLKELTSKPVSGTECSRLFPVGKPLQYIGIKELIESTGFIEATLKLKNLSKNTLAEKKTESKSLEEVTTDAEHNEEEDSESDEDGVSQVLPLDKSIQPLMLESTAGTGGFGWSDLKFANRDEDVSDNEEDENESTGIHDETKKNKSKRQKDAEKKRHEGQLRNIEADNLAGEWAKDPQTADDFERLIMTQGNASAIWIKYMAFHLKMNELQKARHVAQRAVKQISFREDGERLNVWIAYLNMECAFGDNIDEVFRQAAQYNDAKKIYYQMTFVYQRNKQMDKCLEFCRKSCDKFHESKKMWLRYLQVLYEHSKDSNAGQKVLVEALRRLPKRKHISVVAAVAKLEYLYGSTERGQTLFENLVAERPNRTDLWCQFFDAQIAAFTPPKTKVADLRPIRRIFEKAVAINVKPRKMKALFTRWLKFEMKFGDLESQGGVQQKAREFVEKVERS